MGREQMRPAHGLWLLALAAAAGTGLAIYAYFYNEGINHTDGVLLVMGTSAIMAVAAVVLAWFPRLPRWLRGIGLLLVLIDIAGTALAAWFLETQLLMAFMGVALLGWLLHLVAGPPRVPRRRPNAAVESPA